MVYLLMSWMNLYLGAIGALLGATLGAPVIIQWARQLIRKQLKPVPGLVWALFACALLSFPLMAWQHALSVGESALGSPAMFRASRRGQRDLGAIGVEPHVMVVRPESHWRRFGDGRPLEK